MSTRINPALWAFLDKHRGQGFHDPMALLRMAKAEGLAFSHWDMLEALRQLNPRAFDLVTPRSVLDFVAKLLCAHGVRSVLHPWSGHPWDALGLTSLIPDISYELFCMNAEAPEMIGLFDVKHLKCHVGGYAASQHGGAAVDALVSFGPVGLAKTKATIAGIVLNDDPGLLAMAEAAQRLGPDGVVIWLVTPLFAFNAMSSGVKANLAAVGLHLNGWIQLPPDAFAPVTSVPFAFAVLHCKDLGKVYACEMPSASEAIDAFVVRFMKRKAGQLLGHGLLVDRSEFRGVMGIKRMERFRALVRNKDTVVPFDKAVLRINRSKKSAKDFEHLPEHPDAVYLPLMGRTKATTNQHQLPLALKSYAQLVVDRNVVDPDYLANWLNTDAGHAFRELASTGTTIPAISLEGLKWMELPLPSPTMQKQFAEAQRSIVQLRTELNEAEQALWSGGRPIAEVISVLPSTDHAKRFGDWVETLPFPLASILRQYHASDLSEKDKYDRLLHFFEALAEFVATIHLSAYTPDPVLWPAMQEKLKRSLNGAVLDFRKASFGLWCTVLNALGKETRASLNGGDEEQRAVVDRYQVANTEVLHRLVDKSLSTVLESTNNMRNRKAHGGVISEQEAKGRHEELRRQLDALRERWTSSFYQLRMIQVGQAEILPTGTMRFTTTSLTGSNPQFAHEKMELSLPAITGRLYMHQIGHDRALEIAPLIQMRQKEQAACYFYNRMEGSVPHLVSYHFEHRSDEIDDSGAAVEFLKKLAHAT